jgi:ABC-type lipoprotein export system ATPase subunit
MQILDDLNAQGRTIVMVTHEAEVALHAQRTLHVRDGRIEKVHENGFAPGFTRGGVAAAPAGGKNESL